jgi:hypothetical protein
MWPYVALCGHRGVRERADQFLISRDQWLPFKKFKGRSAALAAPDPIARPEARSAQNSSSGP